MPASRSPLPFKTVKVIYYTELKVIFYNLKEYVSER